NSISSGPSLTVANGVFLTNGSAACPTITSTANPVAFPVGQASPQWIYGFGWYSYGSDLFSIFQHAGITPLGVGVPLAYAHSIGSKPRFYHAWHNNVQAYESGSAD